MKKYMEKYLLNIIVFICGALGMVIELIAARILSPYVGSSNLIWTTIIGVMLTSMSLGYWLGGKIADKKPDKNILALLILIGAFAASLIPIMETVIIKYFSQVISNLEIVAFISAAIVFGIPSFILATVSPYAIKLKDEEYKNIGKLSGRLSSISTLGSIVGTFTAGFLLIPNFGVRNIILGVTIILVCLAIALSIDKSYKKMYWLIVGIILICIISFNYIGKVIFENSNPDIVEDVDSQYSRIWVKEIEYGSSTYKTLQVDTGLESYINTETGEMGAEYLKYYDLFDYFNKNAKDTLIIGGAAYTYPMHYLQNYEDKNIDVVEIDDEMTKVAERQFGLDLNNNKIKVYNQDGRSYLNYTKNKYDVILIDAFKGLNAPFELTTTEALTNAKNVLNENGMVITNIISSIEGKDSNFIKYEYNTYKAIFDDVKVFAVQDIEKDKKQNLILIGFKGDYEDEKDLSSKYDKYKWLLERELKDFSSDKKIVTDDYAPIGT